eukprot:9746122-Karenia_brevis.AAC.1
MTGEYRKDASQENDVSNAVKRRKLQHTHHVDYPLHGIRDSQGCSAGAGAVVILRAPEVPYACPKERSSDVLLCNIAVPVSVDKACPWFAGADALTIGCAEISAVHFFAVSW